MSKEATMYAEIERWKSSGKTKRSFLEGKAYSTAKFEYWLRKWRSSQNEKPSSSFFHEIDLDYESREKLLEIKSPSGLQIIVFG